MMAKGIVRVMIKPDNPRQGEVGVWKGTEKTIIGWLHRIEFPNGQAGLYDEHDFILLEVSQTSEVHNV